MSTDYITPPVAPAAGIARGVPLTDPRHWSHHRRAQTDAELAELAAASFTTDPGLELALLLRDRHPDEVDRLYAETRAVLDDYAARRARAIEGGRTVSGPGPAVAAAIDAAIEELRATDAIPAAFAGVDTDHRAAFGEALRTKGVDAALAVYARWRSALDEVDAFLGRRAAARNVIGLLPDASPRQTRPSFLREIDKALDGRAFG